MDAKHDEKQCAYCDKIFSNEQTLTKHHQECIDIVVPNSICNKCNETFTYQGLKRHKPSCHGGKKYLECHDCGEMLSNANALKKHKEKEHTAEAHRSK